MKQVYFTDNEKKEQIEVRDINTDEVIYAFSTENWSYKDCWRKLREITEDEQMEEVIKCKCGKIKNLGDFTTQDFTIKEVRRNWLCDCGNLIILSWSLMPSKINRKKAR